MLRKLFGLGRSNNVISIDTFKCPDCGDVYPTRGTLEDHVMMNHVKVQYFCVHCGIEYNFTRYEMDLHKRHCKKHRCIYCNEYCNNLNEHSQQCIQFKQAHQYNDNRPTDILRSLFESLDPINISQESSSRNSNDNDLFNSLRTESYGTGFFGLFDALNELNYHISPTDEKPSNVPIIPILPKGEDAAASDETPESDLCKICMSNIANTINLPCAHIYFCVKCSNDYVTQFNETKCPVCKLNMSEVKRYFK